MNEIVYVTGSDGNRMLNTGILLDSFQQFMPDEKLHICDFGFDERERGIWQALGVLRPVPNSLFGHTHPWSRKASLIDYFDDRDGATLVWLDADMLLLGSIHERVQETASEMQRDNIPAAACPDASGRTVAGFIQDFSAVGADVGPFSDLVQKHGTDITAPYMNTGFFILGDMAFARLWRDEVLAGREWLLFEQNTFNALAGQKLLLDAEIWNVHGDLLADISISEEQAPLILHATSEQQRHHIENEIRYPIGDQVLPGWFKMFERPDLRQLQQDHLVSFLRQNLTLIEKCGLLVK